MTDATARPSPATDRAAPLIPGDWLRPDFATHNWIVAHWSRALGQAHNPFLSMSVTDLHWLGLSCYPDFMLAEARIDDGEGRIGHIDALIGPDGVLPIDGCSALLHRLNAEGRLRLDEPDRVRSYVLLFGSAVWGSDGRFQIVERAEDLLLAGGRMPDEPAVLSIVTRLKQVVAVAQNEGIWRADATLVYAGKPFAATFHIQRSGAIEMVEDDPLTIDGANPFRRERCSDAIRWQGEQDSAGD